jgi:hypothetical protein
LYEAYILPIAHRNHPVMGQAIQKRAIQQGISMPLDYVEQSFTAEGKGLMCQRTLEFGDHPH